MTTSCCRSSLRCPALPSLLPGEVWAIERCFAMSCRVLFVLRLASLCSRRQTAAGSRRQSSWQQAAGSSRQQAAGGSSSVSLISCDPCGESFGRSREQSPGHDSRVPIPELYISIYTCINQSSHKHTLASIDEYSTHKRLQTPNPKPLPPNPKPQAHMRIKT